MSTYILPGMGADASMYGPAFRQLAEVIYLDWPAYDGETTIAQVARTIAKRHSVTSQDLVGGSSLGGIVAAEVAAAVNAQKVILIGSTLTPNRINPVLKRLSVLADVTPLDLATTFAEKVSSIHASRVLDMFSRSDTNFIRAMSKAVFAWPGIPKPTFEVAHIHGARDQVIYPPPEPDSLIPDGGHLIAMTHEADVAEFVRVQSAT